MSHQIDLVSVGPALVDITADLTDHESLYQSILELLKVAPGGWIELQNGDMLMEVLAQLIDQANFDLSADFAKLLSLPYIDVIAGSTGLDIISALTAPQRQRAMMATAVGTVDGRGPDAAAQFFAHEVAQLGSQHYGVKILGNTPLGLVISSGLSQDKVLAMYPGISRQLDQLPPEVTDAIVHIEAYELRHGKLSEVLDQLIKSGRSRIAIGLGNHTILTDTLRAQLMGYIQQGLVSYLMGNEREYATLLGLDQEHGSLSILTAVQSSTIITAVPHVLVTLGTDGLAAMINGECYYQPAHSPDKIVNTSGAGDAAAGVFLEGLMTGKTGDQILAEAVGVIDRVLAIPGSRLRQGR